MIKMYIEYRQQQYEFPINPEYLVLSEQGNNQVEDTIGLGEITIIKKPRLKTTPIDSFILSDDNPQKFIKFINEIRADEKPARLIVTDLDINMLIAIDNFEPETRAGEEEDLYFTLEITEWRDYSPQKVVLQLNPQTNQQEIVKKETVYRRGF